MWDFAPLGFSFLALAALTLLLGAADGCQQRQNPTLELDELVHNLGARPGGCDPLDAPRGTSGAGSSAGPRGGRAPDVRRVWITLGNALLAGLGCEDWHTCPGRPTCSQVSCAEQLTCSQVSCAKHHVQSGTLCKTPRAVRLVVPNSSRAVRYVVQNITCSQVRCAEQLTCSQVR